MFDKQTVFAPRRADRASEASSGGEEGVPKVWHRFFDFFPEMPENVLESVFRPFGIVSSRNPKKNFPMFVCLSVCLSVCPPPVPNQDFVLES